MLLIIHSCEPSGYYLAVKIWESLINLVKQDLKQELEQISFDKSYFDSGLPNYVSILAIGNLYASFSRVFIVKKWLRDFGCRKPFLFSLRIVFWQVLKSGKLISPKTLLISDFLRGFYRQIQRPSRYKLDIARKNESTVSISHVFKFLACQGAVMLGYKIRNSYFEGREFECFDLTASPQTEQLYTRWGRREMTKLEERKNWGGGSNILNNISTWNSEELTNKKGNTLLFEEFCGASIALIGPSGNENELSKSVGSFDYVARMGHRSLGAKSKLESRTDILFLGSGKKEQIKLLDERIIYCLPKSHNFKLSPKATKFELRDNLHGIWWSGHPLNTIRAVLNLLSWGVKEIEICGVDFYLERSPSATKLGVPWASWWWHTWHVHDPLSNLLFFKLMLEAKLIKPSSSISLIFERDIYCNIEIWERNYTARMREGKLFEVI